VKKFILIFLAMGAIFWLLSRYFVGDPFCVFDLFAGLTPREIERLFMKNPSINIFILFICIFVASLLKKYK